MDDELKSILSRAAATLRAEGAQEVYVLGSAATGTLEPESDIDMAVSGLSPERFFRAASRAEDILRRPLDLMDLDEPSPLVRHLRKEGALVRVQ